LRTQQRVRRAGLSLIALGFGLFGYVLLQRTFAATYAVPKEAETAALAGKASVASSSTASGSNAVAFGNTGAWTTADLFVDPQSNAAKQAAAWNTSNPAGAARMRKMALGGEMNWIGDWVGGPSNVQSTVANYMNRVTAQGANKIGLIALYAIPYRDCGGHSGGGYVDAATYNNYINAVATGLGTKRAIIILEPDALPQLTACLSATRQTQRLQMLSSAITTLKSRNPNVKVYLDAGNSGWIDATTMAGRLNAAGVAKADGFATNVSNFKTTAAEIAYGNSVSSKIGGKHYVIDTSRNGNGPLGGEWCNPPGRALGQTMTFNTGSPLVDAFLWIKKAGESDGACNGGPSAGTWWPSYADGLARNAGY
jgi:endoglucanase